MPQEDARRYAEVTTPYGPLRLAYDVFGSELGEPLVLVMGIGAQRIFWDEQMIAQFVDAGFRVVRFDHREIGESDRLPKTVAVPKIFALLAKRLAGGTVEAPYDLSDMASDVVAIMDDVGFTSAHVVGVSLGGMVVQHLGLEHPDRVRSITAIMTTTGARRFIPEPRALRALLAPAPRTREDAGRSVEKLFATIGSTAWPTDPARYRDLGERAFDRGTSPRGFLRHFAAVLASGDRTLRLGSIRAPLLAIHGSRDPMFPLAAGRALATHVPRGTWLPIAGMGHDMPPALWPTLVAAIRRHATLANQLAL